VPDRRRGMVLGCLVLLASAGVVLWLGLLGGAVPRASGLQGPPELVAQTDDSAPAIGITLFGASPEEEAGEVWGLAPAAGGSATVRYSQSAGWTFGPQLQNAAGEALQGFSLDTPEAFRQEGHPSPLAGQTTPAGDGALLGTVGSGTSGRQVVLVRDPGGLFKEVVVPEGGEGPQPGEGLFGINSPPLLAALREAGGKAGAFVVPSASGPQGAVLHWDGTSWDRETIEVPPSGATQFEVLAISASSTEDAWLLGRSEGAEGSLALFRRHGGGAPVWRPVATRSGGEAGAPIEIAGETLDEPSRDQAQLLSATSAGVWLDARLRGAKAPATLYFVPEGEADVGTFTGLWCQIPGGSTGATPQAGEECTNHPLPEPLPTDYSRSFAWPGSGGFGERIITGLRDGQMMRLEGGRFEAVNSLGSEPHDDPGATYGAAFASAADGWLGKRLLPVHVTTPAAAAPSRLAPWPVPFRSALTALAPQPGAPIGAANSEVLAVGDRGEVARYHPGAGWFPETLPGPGGKRESPRLRVVAWPTPERAYAVGDSEKGAGQMWLWRGETKLWETDPAIPVNFRGNLLGIAFDPNNSARGYAVGQQGVLLSYGKSWTQEAEANIPPAARGANFTSIAFAGSEAIVAWRKLVQQGQNAYTGGVIGNDGSGWHEDEGADAVLGTNAVPWAVAGLPDGGAAFTAKSSATQAATIYERSAPGQAWEGVGYPGGFAPGALTLFREGGALRAIGTSSEPATFAAEEEVAPPPGFPPILVDPYPLPNDLNRGVVRQTATGWSDEEHELNDAREQPGGYVFWDTPKIPDPVNAVLVDPAGAQGWAVGGVVNNKHPLLDTADISRYPSSGGEGSLNPKAPETVGAGSTAVAIGGGAACAAPCATRSDTGTGPTLWLQRAIGEAHEITTAAKAGGSAGIGAFLYTGPGVTTGEVAGPHLFPVPWQAEENYYAERTSSGEPFVCAASSPTDREGAGEGSETSFEAAFASAGAPCRSGHASGANFEFAVGQLHVIVIDTSLVQGGERALAGEEIAWLGERLEEAQGHAIVVGNADLPQEASEGRSAARALVAQIEAGKAAAYFFDSPEQNVTEHLTGSPASTPAYGSGTLGYVNVIGEEQAGFIGQSGFLVAEVSNTETEKPSGRYRAQVKLVPDIEELAVEAEQGTLLRRSQVAAFAGLARRPRAGNRSRNQLREFEVAPYVEIPSNCRGANCARGIAPEYRFRSSDSHYGAFVKRNFNSALPNAVLHDSHGKPISQEAEGGKDGLFCAFNATPPGKPVEVILETGNLRYSLPVTIQAGSVRQPCGTTPLFAKAAVVEAAVAPPPASEPPPAGNATPTSLNVSPPSAPAALPATPASHPPVHQFLPQPAPVAFLPAFVPVPLPTPARPTPPSGTSAVTSPVEAAQKEEEEEAAPESVDAAASAYHPSEHETPPVYLLGLIVLAALAGASLRGRRRPRRGPRVAPATVSASRTQQRWERDERHGRHWDR
jgi:hypothetical protein